MTFPVAIAAASCLTPLDHPSGRDTWAAMRGGHAVADAGIIDDALLPTCAHSSTGQQLPQTTDRATQLAFAAILGAFRYTDGFPADAALFVGTSKGPALSQLAALAMLDKHQPIPESLARQVILGPAAIGHDLAAALHLPGPVHTSVAACSSGLHALYRAVRAIEFGEVRRALVVAADASHHPLFEASFARLGVLASPDAEGRRICRPFDPSGNGFVVSEAAAAILLERADPADARVHIAASRIAADSTGLIAIDPTTETLRHTLRTLLDAAHPPSFVHAHATGTAHDTFELTAIRAVCGDVPVLASKGHLGHSLGAAGLVSLVLSHRCHLSQSTWTGHPVPASARSITLSQGFGGHVAAVQLRSP